ncbi:MAG: VOC family protein [Actinomycetota bacterium]|nr:VOC family protein [Actinomycetota bacterium]
MPLARYKDLCIDATDLAASAGFWAGALGLSAERHTDAIFRLSGPTPEHTVWVNLVPEPHVVKNRVHIDVHGRAVDDVVALGGTVVDAESFRWVVMTDPDGQELCLFVREEPPAYRLYELIVDSNDHESDAAWWQQLIGGRIETEEDEDGTASWLADVPGLPFEGILFGPVPEPKKGKNRVHVDVSAPALGPILDAGATLLRRADDEVRWNVVADPAGNELCVFVTDP